MNCNYVGVTIVEAVALWYVATDYQNKEIEIKNVGPAIVRSGNLETARRALMKMILTDIDAWTKWNRGGCRITVEVM